MGHNVSIYVHFSIWLIIKCQTGMELWKTKRIAELHQIFPLMQGKNNQSVGLIDQAAWISSKLLVNSVFIVYGLYCFVCCFQYKSIIAHSICDIHFKTRWQHIQLHILYVIEQTILSVVLMKCFWFIFFRCIRLVVLSFCGKYGCGLDRYCNIDCFFIPLFLSPFYTSKWDFVLSERIIRLLYLPMWIFKFTWGCHKMFKLRFKVNVARKSSYDDWFIKWIF